MNIFFLNSHLVSRSKFIGVFLLGVLIFLRFPASPAYANSISVNSTADTSIPGDSECTLREAVTNANSDSDTTGGDCAVGSGSDTIGFSPNVLGQTITLTGSEIFLSSDIEITASTPGLTIDANNSSKIFTISSGSTISLTNLRMKNGMSTVTNGGAIQNTGTLTINDSTIEHNTVSKTSAIGGGIVNGASGSLTINNSTIHNNMATSTGGSQAGGGGISNSGVMILNNTTVSENKVTASPSIDNGGGIRNTSGAIATLNNSTISNNTTAENGGGISNGGSVTLHNTILADNSAVSLGTDCRGSIILNHSLVGNTNGCTISNMGGNLLNVIPQLMPLDVSGGGTTFLPTFTAFPLDNSPALNAGNNATCLAIDQRGYPRPVGTCDMGAVEKQTGEETDQHCSWSPGVPHAFGTDVNVTLTPNTISSTSACLSVLKRPEYPGLSQTNGEFPIMWTVAAPEGIVFDLDIDFCYTDSELLTAGVTDEASIVIFHLQNGTWQNQTTTPNPASNCVSVTGVTSLSLWTIVGNNDTPTIIELQNLTAQTARSPQGLSLLLLALLGLGTGIFLIRSRK